MKIFYHGKAIYNKELKEDDIDKDISLAKNYNDRDISLAIKDIDRDISLHQNYIDRDISLAENDIDREGVFQRAERGSVIQIDTKSGLLLTLSVNNISS